MRIKTKIFGEVEIDEEKIICFEQGIIGFPDLTRFVLMHDSEREDGCGVRWLQSLEEPAFAMPVMDPLLVMPDYNPQVEEDLLRSVGGLKQDSMLILVTLTVPSQIRQMSVNLRAPIVIQTETKKACQIIAEDDRYLVKYPIYDILQAAKEAEK